MLTRVNVFNANDGFLWKFISFMDSTSIRHSNWAPNCKYTAKYSTSLASYLKRTNDQDLHTLTKSFRQIRFLYDSFRHIRNCKNHFDTYNLSAQRNRTLSYLIEQQRYHNNNNNDNNNNNKQQSNNRKSAIAFLGWTHVPIKVVTISMRAIQFMEFNESGIANEWRI